MIENQKPTTPLEDLTLFRKQMELDIHDMLFHIDLEANLNEYLLVVKSIIKKLEEQKLS